MIHKSAARNLALDYPEKKRQELLKDFGIENCVTLAASQGKYTVTVHMDFEDQLPQIMDALRHYGYTVAVENPPHCGLVISWE